jgi:hypothetical protein
MTHCCPEIRQMRRGTPPDSSRVTSSNRPDDRTDRRRVAHITGRLQDQAKLYAILDRLRPRSTPDDVVARVVRERTEGKTGYAMARDLNKDAVPTAQGARAWSQATVRALLMAGRSVVGLPVCWRTPPNTAGRWSRWT